MVLFYVCVYVQIFITIPVCLCILCHLPFIVDSKDPIEKLYEYSTLFSLGFPITIKQVAVIYYKQI